MKGGCWKQERKEGMGIEKVVKEEAQLSGAYIRSLVKQLTSSRSKDSNPSAADQLVEDGNAAQNLTNLVGEAAGSGFSDTRPPAQSSSSNPHPQPQPHKKQVRRRLHTSRPYQERLLNMAEARREIVTALKFHRAAMKQAAANDHHQQQQQQHEEEEEEDDEQLQQQQQLQQQPSSLDQYSSSISPPPFQPKTSKSSRRNPRIYPAAAAAASSNTTRTINTNTFSPPSCFNNNNNNYNLDTTATTFPNYYYYYNYNYNNNNNNSSSDQNYPPPNPYSNWPPTAAAAASIPTTVVDDATLNLALPNQTLGLNLNFHDFNSIIDDDTTLNYPNTTNPSIYSSPSSSSNSPPLTEADQLRPVLLPPSADHQLLGSGSTELYSYGGGGSSGLHQAINEEEMAEIRSLGEQHQMEWNDTMNLVTSAWWFKFLKTMELGPADQPKPPAADDDDAFQPFDQLAQFPAWLNTNYDHHFNDHLSFNFKDPALPCMDIGEIEGMDGDWLA